MSENFTQQHKLVEEISNKGWPANIAGRDGYEIVLLKKVGDGGTHFHRILKPGETLKWHERIFGNFMALTVDMRYGRSFLVERTCITRERGCEVVVKANVCYRVINTRTVAVGTDDPLGKLRDKVIATLNRELATYLEIEIGPTLVEQIIRSIGWVPELGLKIEDAEVIEFMPNTRLVKEEKLHLLEEHGQLARDVFGAFANRDQVLLKARLEEIKPAIKDYIDRQREIEDPIDPEMILHWLDLVATSSGTWIRNLVETGQLVLDNDIINQLPSKELLPTPPKVKESEGDGSKKSPDNSSFT